MYENCLTIQENENVGTCKKAKRANYMVNKLGSCGTRYK